MPFSPAVPTQTTGGWNSSGLNQTQPSSGKIALGWIVDEKPAGSYFNWLLFVIDAWITWALSITTGAVTWVFNHTFSAGLTIPSGATETVSSGGTLTAAHGSNVNINGTQTFGSSSALALTHGASFTNSGLTAAGNWLIETALQSQGVKTNITSSLVLLAGVPTNTLPAGLYRINCYASSSSQSVSPDLQILYTDPNVNGGSEVTANVTMNYLGNISSQGGWYASAVIYLQANAEIIVNMKQGGIETIDTAMASIAAIF